MTTSPVIGVSFEFIEDLVIKVKLHLVAETAGPIFVVKSDYPSTFIVALQVTSWQQHVNQMWKGNSLF